MTLVDTSSWIEFIRADGALATKNRVSMLLDQGQAVWCDAVRVELWNGAGHGRDKAILRDFERELIALPIDQTVWDGAAELARSARDRGFTMPATDLVIFACAVRHNVPLEHQDGHFEALARL